MTDGFRRRFFLASLSAPAATDAFGSADPRREPPEATDLLRSLADTRTWVTDDPGLLGDAERGDFVLFHDATGVRGVAQVWATSGAPDDVARFTALDDPGAGWGVLTLTNYQAAKDYVSLLSLGLRDDSRDDLLYRVEDEATIDALGREYGTPYAMLADVVPDPLQFDVPPDGTPSDRRPTTAAPSPPEVPAPDESVLRERYRSLDAAARLAWGALAVTAAGVALAVVAAATIPHTSPLAVTPFVGGGLFALTVAVSLAAGVLVRGALRPRPGLDAVQAVDRRTANALAGMTDARSRAGVLAHRADAYHDAAGTVTDAAERRGTAAAVAVVASLVGVVVLGYGVAAQVSNALDPLAPALAVGVPLLVVVVAAAAALFDPVGVGERLLGLRDLVPGRDRFSR